MYEYLDEQQTRYEAWERFSRLMWLGRLTLRYRPTLVQIEWKGKTFYGERRDH